jgi:uncharacterized SAM-binding protein YcdF (DUF218 family)
MTMLRRRGRRGRRKILIILGALITAFLVLSSVLFIWPATNAPRRSDAIVVLGGGGSRLPKGVALARAGYAPYLVVSIGDPEDHIGCPTALPKVSVICFIPVPATTQGEARAVARLARTHHWRQIIVVSGTPQTTRARIRFDRCYHGTLLFDPAGPGGLGSWIRNVFYEWGALAKALTLQRGC